MLVRAADIGVQVLGQVNKTAGRHSLGEGGSAGKVESDGKAWMEVVVVQDILGESRIVIGEVEVVAVAVRLNYFDDSNSM